MAIGRPALIGGTPDRHACCCSGSLTSVDIASFIISDGIPVAPRTTVLNDASLKIKRSRLDRKALAEKWRRGLLAFKCAALRYCYLQSAIFNQRWQRRHWSPTLTS